MPVDHAARFASTPINRWYGLELGELEAGAATVRLAPRSEFAQEEGIVHGGVLTTLADTAAVYAVHPHQAPGETLTSIEFKLNFLRPALVTGGQLVARSRAVRVGRRVAVVEVDVEQGRHAVAKGLFTYLVYSRARGDAGPPGDAPPDGAPA